jgi:DNA-binding NarL/FixJ family response regulator
MKIDKKSFKILFIDDHDMILEGYKTSLRNCEEYNLDINVVNNIDDAHELIQTENYDIVFFDLRMPTSEKLGIENGEQLAIQSKKISPNTKIVFITSYDDLFLFQQLIKNIDPDGILIKSEVNSSSLKSAIQEIIEHPPHYSKTVKQKIRSASKDKLDFFDTEIIYKLSQGVLTRDLHNHMNLSQRSIETRKKRLKELFDIENNSDYGLIAEAKNRGFL